MNKIQNENWINALPEEAVKVAEEINIEISKVIAERIKAIGELSPSDVKKLTNSLQYLGADFGKITKLIAKYSDKGQMEIVDMLKEVADSNDEFANVFYSGKGIAAVRWQEDTYLRSLVEAMARQTIAEFTNLSQTLAYKIEDRTLSLRQMYTRAIDKAIYEVQSGTVDYHTAMRKTVKQLSNNMRLVKWESGYSRRLDSHIRQNLIDGIKQLQTEMLNYHGERFGSDGVEISAHAISAPDHVAVQGRQFSNEEFYKIQSAIDFKDVKGKKYKAFARPIGQWNCRHVRFPIIIGISEPAYTEEQLKEFAENSKEKYDLTQRQRAMETKLRQLKIERLTASASGDELEAKRIQRKINEQQAIYRNFSNKHNLLYDTKRASVEGYRRISVKDTNVKNLIEIKSNNLEIAVKSDIIKDKPILTMEQTVEKAKQMASNPKYKDVKTMQEIRSVTKSILGYDGMPNVVAPEEFEKLSKNNTILYRGVHASETKTASEIIEEFKTGALWTGNTGQAVFGNGVYFTATESLAMGEYARNGGAVIEALVDKSAKIADYQTINKEFEETGILKIIGQPKEDYQMIIRDVGQYAAVKGYDAIALNGYQGHDYVILLNRTKCIIKG